MSEPALPKQKRPRGTGSIYTRKSSPFWWISYYRNGKLFRESTNTDQRKKAEKMLQQRLAQIATGTFVGFQAEKVRVEELANNLIRDYRINDKSSVHDVESRWNLHLKPFFGHLRAVDVTTSLVAEYVDQRLKQGAANATVNRELSALKRMYNLALQSTPPVVRTVPYIPHLTEDNVRIGFVEPEQHQKLARVFAGVGLWMRSLFECGYVYGWRVSELLNLKAKQVDFVERLIRLETGTTKNKKGRVVKMTDTVFQLLQQCCMSKKPDQCVFTRANGKAVRDFRVVWENGCTEAGLPDLLFHDLRRTAVRNMVRAGVAEHQAMKISGHKTRSTFDRYDIVNEKDIANAVQKIEKHQSHAHYAHTEAIVTVSQTAVPMVN